MRERRVRVEKDNKAKFVFRRRKEKFSDLLLMLKLALANGFAKCWRASGEKIIALLWTKTSAFLRRKTSLL